MSTTIEPDIRPVDVDWRVPEAGQKDSWRRGPPRKITDAQVAEIRTKRAAGAKQVQLAAEYGVSSVTISNICAGKVRKVCSAT